MYYINFVYVDESGDYTNYFNRYGNKPSPFFNLSAIIVNESTWKFIDRKLDMYRKSGDICKLISPSLEFHTSDIASRVKPYNNFGEDDVVKLFKSFAKFLSCLDIKVINVLFNKLNAKKEFDIFNITTNMLLNRLETASKNTFSNESYLLFCDEGHSVHWTKSYNEFLHNNYIESKYSKERIKVTVNNIMEVPISRKSKDVNLIQVADFIAYIVSRYFRLNYTDILSKKKTIYLSKNVINELMDILKPILITDAHKDDLYGVVNYPKR